MDEQLYAVVATAARYLFALIAIYIVFKGWRAGVVDARRARLLRGAAPEMDAIGELVTTGEVDDGEPSVANRHAGSGEGAAVIRAAVDEAGVHRGEGLLTQVPAGTVEKSINSTHGGIVAL